MTKKVDLIFDKKTLFLMWAKRDINDKEYYNRLKELRGISNENNN